MKQGALRPSPTIRTAYLIFKGTSKLLVETILSPSSDSKTFQNRNVSSAPAETTVVISGLKLKCKTLSLCPYMSPIFCMLGYFHRLY